MSKFRTHCKCSCAFCVLVLTLGQCPCFAQANTESPRQEATLVDQQIPPAIQKELANNAAMTKMIFCLFNTATAMKSFFLARPQLLENHPGKPDYVSGSRRLVVQH